MFTGGSNEEVKGCAVDVRLVPCSTTHLGTSTSTSTAGIIQTQEIQYTRVCTRVYSGSTHSRATQINLGSQNIRLS